LTFSFLPFVNNSPLLLVSLIIGVLALLFTVILSIRLCMLPILLITTKQSTAVPTFFNFYVTKPFIPVPSPSAFSELDIPVSTIMYLSACVFALYVVCTSYKCMTRFCQRLRRTIPKDILCILFTEDKDIVSVEIMTLHKYVLNYKFHTDVAFASCSFKVLAFFRPHLFIDWPSFMMHE